jgi:hypothetical protein
MNQKSSLIQILKSVQQALTLDNLGLERFDLLCIQHIVMWGFAVKERLCNFAEFNACLSMRRAM